MNREIAQDLMAPLLQQFFSCFDGIYSLHNDENGCKYVTRKYSLCEKYDINCLDMSKKPENAKFVGLDESSGASFPNKPDRRIQNVSIDDVLANDKFERNNNDEKFAEIYETFSPSVAYHAYVLFCRVLGNIYIENTLYNSDLVLQLCAKYDDRLTMGKNNGCVDNNVDLLGKLLIASIYFLRIVIWYLIPFGT